MSPEPITADERALAAHAIAAAESMKFEGMSEALARRLDTIITELRLEYDLTEGEP